MLTGLLTGHCLVAVHAKRLGMTDNDECRKCKESGVKETLEHLLCSCPALAAKRLQHIQVPFLASLEEASKLEPNKLLALARSILTPQDHTTR